MKVNINRQKEEKVKEMLKHQKGASMTSKDQKFFDQNLLISSLVKEFFFLDINMNLIKKKL